MNPSNDLSETEDTPEPVETDVFSILANALNDLSQDVQHLQRTSLDKNEAAALNKNLMVSVDKITKASFKIQGEMENKLAAAVRNIRGAAIEAANVAVKETHAESMKAAASLSQAAGEARKEAWRRFGGFWVWLVSVGVTGVLLGVLIAFLIIARGDAIQLGRFTNTYCNYAGGQVYEQDGGTFCAIWIKQALLE